MPACFLICKVYSLRLLVEVESDAVFKQRNKWVPGVITHPWDPWMDGCMDSAQGCEN